RRISDADRSRCFKARKTRPRRILPRPLSSNPTCELSWKNTSSRCWASWSANRSRPDIRLRLESSVKLFPLLLCGVTAILAGCARTPGPPTRSERDATDYFKRSQELYQKGELAGALSACNEAIKLNPRYAEAYHQRGVVRVRQGHLEEAIADFN